MISPRPLFSGFFSTLWSAALFLAFLSGIAHLPIPLWEQLQLHPIISQGKGHIFACMALIFLASYAAVIWFLEGAKKYRITLLGKGVLTVTFLVLFAGLCLFAHITGVILLEGLLFSLCKCLHLCGAFLLALLSTILFVLRLFAPFPFIVKRS